MCGFSGVGRQFGVPRLRITTSGRAIVIDLPVPYRGFKVHSVEQVGRRRRLRVHRRWLWHRFDVRTRKLKR
jgi:hypothetical protein